MAISGTSRIVAALLAATLVPPGLMTAGDKNLSAWQNLGRLAAGQDIEVTTKDHKTVRGSFLSFGDQVISLRRKQKDLSVPRTDVTRVRLHSPKGRSYMWIGAAIGGGAGASVGVGVGEYLANQSGGDFRNLKPAIIGVCGVVGALAGLLIGSVVSDRHGTVYAAG